MASNAEIAGIFGFDSQAKINELIYWTFVIMARAGIRALEWFDPKTGKHGQAHMEARLGITNWMVRPLVACSPLVGDLQRGADEAWHRDL